MEVYVMTDENGIIGVYNTVEAAKIDLLDDQDEILNNLSEQDYIEYLYQCHIILSKQEVIGVDSVPNELEPFITPML